MNRFKRLLKLIKPYWPMLVFVYSLNLIFIGLEMTPPLLTRGIIDKGMKGGDMSVVISLGLLLLAARFCQSVANYFKWKYSECTGQRIIWDLRKLLHDHMQRLSSRYFAELQTGQAMSRLTGDIDSVQDLLAFGLMLLAETTLMFIGVTAVLLSISWKLTLVTAITFPFLFYTVFRFDRKIGPAWEKVREAMGKLTTVLQENVTGVRVVKAFARERYEMGKFADKNRGHYNLNIERAGIEANAQPVMEFLSGLSAIILVWYGGYSVIRGELSIGSLIAFYQSLWSLIWPVRMLGWLVNTANRAFAALPRVYEVLDAKPEVEDAPDAVEMPTVTGRVRFENVCFSFDGKEEILRNIDLTIEPGETVAVIGGTGSGKSTFINLIPRFHNPTSGRITIDGIDISTVTLASLRRQIGMVLQETFLFSASLRENIAYGRPGATDEEIRAAAAIAQAAGFIDKLPKGYATRVGERGVGLSGGQKQRVALARAVLMDPRILILDEATASVDTETEYLIQEGLEEIMQGRTTIIIAKRLSTILSADKVIVLQGGEVAEFGTHAELLARGGIYKRIFEGQFAKAADLNGAAAPQALVDTAGGDH
ncbi:MAG: ABC transporter ATP-binding protein [Chloroflexota bacterium]